MGTSDANVDTLPVFLCPVSGCFGSQLARYLCTEVHQHSSAPPTRAARPLTTLQPGDVLLVEGARGALFCGGRRL